MLGLGKSRSIATPSIGETSVRVAAELIDSVEGKRGDRQVSDRDVERVKGYLEQRARALAASEPDPTPLRALYPSEIEAIQKNVDALEGLLARPRAEGRRRAFATSIRVDAIACEDTRRTARAVLTCFEADDGELSLGQIIAAKRALGALAGAAPANVDPALVERLAAKLATQEIVREDFDKLDLFMMSGKGGLVSFGPVRINGHPFTDVFRLPGDPAVVAQDPTKALGTDDRRVLELEAVRAGADDDDGKKKAPKEGALDELLDRYEQRFQGTGYDRIYFRGFDGHLYVALHEHGELPDVRPFYRVQMKEDGELANSGEVLRVVDVNNSLFEATVGFWRQVVKKVASAVRGLLYERLDGDIRAAAKKVAEKKAEDRGGRETLLTLLTTTAVASTVGLVSVHLPEAAALVGGSAALVTAANVVDYLTKGQNKAPYYHAAGVTVNQGEPLVY